MLTGTWIPQGAEFCGEALPTPQARLVITGDRYVVDGAAGREEGTLKIDPTVMPHQIDLIGTSGPSAGRTLPGIFRLRGNLLQICYLVGDDSTTAPRPAELTSDPGSMQMLVRYRRLATD